MASTFSQNARRKNILKYWNDCTKKRMLITLIILTLVFIWGNSALPSEPSNAISNEVTAAVGGEINNNDMQESSETTWLTSEHIRKLAHVTEFAVLGIVVALLAKSRKIGACSNLSALALCGLSVAVIDETIQLFNDRTSAVKDIWIDFGGFTIGCCVALLTGYLLTKRKTTHGQAS